VGRERRLVSRFHAATGPALTPLVGREEEIALLLQRWEQVQEDDGQVVLLAGEPGIGKSPIAQSNSERLGTESHALVLYQCLPAYRHSPFYPFIAQLEQAARLAAANTPAEKISRLETWLAQQHHALDEAAPLLAGLLSLPLARRYPPLRLSPQRQKTKTCAALVAQILGLSRTQPVVCLVEDIHLACAVERSSGCSSDIAHLL
jgi:predicted ATPase